MKLKYSFSIENECEVIHDYSVDILKHTGISVQSEEARSIFKYNGARVDGNEVFLNNEIIEKYLSYIPKSFSMNVSNYNVEIGSGDLCTIPTYGAAHISRNGITRPSTREDFINLSKINHLNKNISMSCPYVAEPSDLPIEYREKYKLAMSIKYSDKPTFSISHDRRTAENSIEFIKHFFDNQENYILIGNVNLSSPLVLAKNTSDVIMVHGEKYQPLMISCSGLSGLTSPPTLASNFLLNNAATIGGIVFSQMISPGLPIVYGFPLFGIDSINAHVSVGHPSTALFTMAAVSMARYYKIPVRTGGTYTDSKLLDYQSGFESFMNLFSSLHSETDLLMHTFGMENSLNSINYNKYILDEALFESTLLYLKGFEITHETLMIDEIKRVGNNGNFISIDNLRLMRDEYPPYPFKYKSLDEAYAETDRIINERIASYEPLQLDKKQIKLLENILPTEFID